MGKPAEEWILRRLFETFDEDNYEIADRADWTLDPDSYADFLESCRIGHRRLREWVHETRAGVTVTLTAKGVALFDAIAQGMEAEGRDPKGLGAKPDSPVPEGHAP